MESDYLVDSNWIIKIITLIHFNLIDNIINEFSNQLKVIF